MDETLHIYARVSTSAQEDEGTSIATQIDAGVERAKKLNFQYLIWNEGGQSSSRDDLSNRPKLTEILQKIEEGEIKHLYVWNTDRLSRNLTTWGMIRFQLIRNDIKLHTPTGTQVLSDPQTNLMIGILSEIAQYDNKLRTERFRLGKLSRIREGNWMGGPAPFGYRIENHKLVLNIDEQKWVEFVYKSYSTGLTVNEIRDELIRNGVLTRRGNVVWSHGSIAKLLTNTHYSGYFTYKDGRTEEIIRVSCPSILNPDLIKEVSVQRKKRSYKTLSGRRAKTSNQKYSYLLTSFLYCGHCGSRYQGNFKETQTSYYCCSSKTEKYRSIEPIVCTAKRNLRLEDTDLLVWETVINILSNSHLFKESTKLDLLNKNSYQIGAKERKQKTIKLKNLKIEINKITESIINIETTSLLGKRDRNELNQIVKKLEEHRFELEAQYLSEEEELLSVQKQQKWVDWIGEFGKKIKNLKDQEMDTNTKKRFLQGVLEKVTVSNPDTTTHQLTFEFRVPYVDDELMYEKTGKRASKYMIKPGTTIKMINTDLVKKTTSYGGRR